MTAPCACGCTSRTCRRSCRPGRRWTARRSGARTPSTCPGWWSRCCPRRSPTGRARWCRAQDRMAVTVELEFEGAKRAPHRVPSQRHPLGRAAAISRRWTRCSPRASRGPSGLAAARRVARALASRRAARGALAVESTEPEFDFSRDGHVAGVEACEQTESHELIEFLMIAANEAVAGLLETRKLAGAVPRARAARPGARGAPAGPAGVARPAHPARARAHDGASRRASWWRRRARKVARPRASPR